MAFPWAKEHEKLALTLIKEVIFFTKQYNLDIETVRSHNMWAYGDYGSFQLLQSSYLIGNKSASKFIQ